MLHSLSLSSVRRCSLALAGGAIGWWLRGRQKSKPAKRRSWPRQQATAQILQSLQAAAETVRSCVEQHTDCIRTIQSELDEKTATEPIFITKLADSIIESNVLVQHQCNDIRNSLSNQRREIRDSLANSDGLLFTFAARPAEASLQSGALVAGGPRDRISRPDQRARAAAAENQRRLEHRDDQAGAPVQCGYANSRCHGGSKPAH